MLGFLNNVWTTHYAGGGTHTLYVKGVCWVAVVAAMAALR